MKAQEIIKALGIKLNLALDKDFAVKGISVDSKNVGKDFIFVAIPGVSQDGARFIDDAILNGARIIIHQGALKRAIFRQDIIFIKVKNARLISCRLAVVFYGDPSSRIKVIGITGTNGKTTLTYLLEAILRRKDLSSGVIGTINYRYKNKAVPSKNTTPGPLELQGILSEMSKNGVKYCAMEVSSHALDQSRTEGVRFHSAIFTNLTQDHLDYHKTIRRYFNAKLKLFKGLGNRAYAVVNNDDKYADRIKTATRARIITYGIDRKSDIMAANIKFYPSFVEFDLISQGIKTKIKSFLVGRYNVYNILAAVAWALGEKINLNSIKVAIQAFRNVPGRLESIDSERDFNIFVDYAHTDDALKNVITSLKQVSSNKIIVVFGCGGDRDKTKRPKMGRVVTGLADYAIITNDNPRFEDPLDIIKDIKNGIIKDNYCVITNRHEAIKKSLTLAKKGDIVLIAGKGHENYQVAKGQIMHFDDREEVRRCLRFLN